MLRDLAVAPYGGSDVGDILTIAAQVTPGDFESYYSGFYNMAVRVYNTALSTDARRFPVSARNAMFRVSTYFRSSDSYLHGNWSDPRIDSLWVQQATAFNKGLALLPSPGKRLNIKADGFNVSAICFPASGEPNVGRSSSLVVVTMAVERKPIIRWGRPQRSEGTMLSLMRGPGQATLRREQGIGFIVDWEKVVTPVLVSLTFSQCQSSLSHEEYTLRIVSR